MDLKTIVEALQNTLTNGNGSLDDLDNLLTRVKGDIAKAKEEEAAAAKRKAEQERQKLAERVTVANHLLHNQLTDDDVALVLQVYLKQKGIDADVSGKDIAESIVFSQNLTKQLGDFSKALEDLFPVGKHGSKSHTADDTIQDFLKAHGW